MAQSGLFRRFFGLGTGHLDSVEASKVRITNVVAVASSGIALGYAIYFLFGLNEVAVALGNLGFAVAYGMTLLFAHLRLNRWAKSWFFIVLFSHVGLFSTVVFSLDTGFHFYALIVPPGVFLIFNQGEKPERALFTLLAGALFYYCELTPHSEPLIYTTPESAEWIFLSVIFVVMGETYVAMALLNRNIDSYEQELRRSATTDELTGINNRRVFTVVGEELLENAKRFDRPLSLLLLDIDLFKNINDEYGHLVGDTALKAVARTLKDNLRSSDSLARYGGEEFVVILPETDTRGAVGLAEKLRAAVAEITIDVGTHQALTFTTSVGVAQYKPEMRSILQLVSSADTALYKAKNTGRNKVVAA